MSGAQDRFPRAKLFAEAAELQSRIEYWQGNTALKISESDDFGIAHASSKLRQRADTLEIARRLVTELRQRLYECV